MPLFILLAILLASYQFYYSQPFFEGEPVVHGLGQVAPYTPDQYPLDEGILPFQHNGFKITPLEKFEVTARVLNRHDYAPPFLIFGDLIDDLSPVDLALGWQEMSDERYLDQIEIIIPKGSLLNPSDEAAVVGGNVETSQRITDVLLGALGIAAASQGTMNNFVFGSEDNSGKQYYETIAGGSGAIDGFSGASAVQVHMTNTRSTDPEILEHRFREIRLEKFEIRKNSGGNGQYKGGNGVIREISFLEPRKVSIVSERRKIPPYGVSGGDSASCGSNILRQASGEEIDLGGKVERVVKSGETVIIRTPGGGGFGSKT